MFITKRHLSRRTFLRGAGVALSLPLLDAMVPAFARSAPGVDTPGSPKSPRRMLAIQTNLGILPHFLAAHLVHRLGHLADDVKFVEYNLRVAEVLPHPFLIGRAHIDGDLRDRFGMPVMIG